MHPKGVGSFPLLVIRCIVFDLLVVQIRHSVGARRYSDIDTGGWS